MIRFSFFLFAMVLSSDALAGESFLDLTDGKSEECPVHNQVMSKELLDVTCVESKDSGLRVGQDSYAEAEEKYFPHSAGNPHHLIGCGASEGAHLKKVRKVRAFRCEICSENRRVLVDMARKNEKAMQEAQNHQPPLLTLHVGPVVARKVKNKTCKCADYRYVTKGGELKVATKQSIATSEYRYVNEILTDAKLEIFHPGDAASDELSRKRASFLNCSSCSGE